MKIKNVLALLLALVMCTALVACSGETDKSTDTSANTTDLGESAEAKHQEHIRKFISAVSDGNYDEAKKLLHPSSKLAPQKYFTEKGESLRVDFSTGIELRRFTGFGSLEHDGKQLVDYNVMLVVEDVRVYGNISILDDSEGFGVYLIDLYY